MFSDNIIKSFNEMEIAMYQYTLNHIELLPYMTIREFADCVHSSPASILRFCKKIGFSGFTQFKLACKKEVERKNSDNEAKGTDDLFKEFLAMLGTQHYQEKLDKVIQIVKKAERIYCAGDGASGSIAYYAATYFTATGKLAAFIDGKMIRAIHSVSPDLYLLFCVSGESEKLIQVMNKIKECGGKSIVITNSLSSTMSRMADFTLPYNIYFSKDYNKSKSYDYLNAKAQLEDNLSTQIFVVYLVETIATRANIQ